MRRSLGLRAIFWLLTVGLSLHLALGASPSMAAESAPSPSVTVLPFANISGDAAEDFLGDGMSEEFHAALTRVPGLKTMGRASSLGFKGKTADIRPIAAVLPSNFFLKGTVRKVEDRIRIAAQLVRASDSKELWTENYYAKFEDVFEIEEDVVRSAVAAMGVKLNLAPGKMLVPNRTKDMVSYTNYLRAAPLMRARGQQAYAEAAVLLEKITAADPNFAPAAALLSFDYDLMPIFQRALRSGDVAESKRIAGNYMPKADQLARRAVQLDPENATGYVALAYSSMAQRKLLQSDEQFRRALQLDPNHPDGLHGYSQLLAVMGHIKESLAMREHLQSVDPLPVNFTADTAIIIWLAGDREKAIAMLNEFLPGRASEIAQIHASLGRYAEAAKLLRGMNAANYAPGMLEAAASILDAAPAKRAAASLPPVGNLAFVYLHAGAPERVLDFYEGNIQAGYFQPITTTFFWDPAYAPVRRSERFKAFARNVGLVEVWRARGWPDVCKPTGTNDFNCL